MLSEVDARSDGWPTAHTASFTIRPVTDPADEDRGRALLIAREATIGAVIRRIAGRRRLRRDEADEFSAVVYLKLVENQYAVLRTFRGDSSLATYLTKVVGRLYLDWRTSAWGRWRPSAQASRLGPTAVLLERLLRRDGCSFAEASEMLSTNHRVPESRRDLEQLHAALPHRAKRQMVDLDEIGEIPDTRIDPRECECGEGDAARRRRDALARAITALPAADRRLLARRFRDGWRAADIASEIGATAPWVYRRIDTVVRRLRRAVAKESSVGAAGRRGELVAHHV